MSTIHKGLTITVTLDEEKLAPVNALLEKYRLDLSQENEEYRKHLPGTYFISWLTLPSQIYADKEKLPARIILMTSYTGNSNDHLKELVAFMKDKLTAVFSFSGEFPSWDMDENSLVTFLKKKSIRNTFYSGFKFIGTGDVMKEKALKATVYDRTIDLMEEDGFKNLPPKKVKEEIEAMVANDPDLSWASKPITNLKNDKMRMLLPLFFFGLVMAASLVCLILSFFFDTIWLKIVGLIFPAFLMVMVVLFLLLRLNEKNPHLPNGEVPDEKIRKIVALEKNPVVNEMTVIAPLKKGWIRRAFLGVTLRLVALIGYFTYIPTVHTARWLQMDKGKRLVFIATFDNLSEAYAHDFVDSNRRAMNMAVVFSHAFGFPATRWLVHKNYNHRSEYMKGVRAHQKITQFWYTFNRELSVENLKTNRKFREGLFKEMKEEEIRQWLLTI